MPQTIQQTIGVFLLGTAILAVFDAWFPGMFFVTGGCWLWYRYQSGFPLTQAIIGWMLLAVGTMFLLRRLAAGLPAPVLPLLLILGAVYLLSWLKLDD